MGLMDRLQKASTIKYTTTLKKTEILSDIECAPTAIPALNIAFSGSLSGGLTSGLVMIAGGSKNFKSMFGLIFAKAYLDKYDDAVLIFYDSEMGASKEYFAGLGIDESRVLYTPVTSVEELKFDIMHQLEEIKRGDHVVILLDSAGQLASKKEVEDSLAEKSAADFTRAKQYKSLTRMIVPHLNLKNIPMIVINHTYQEMSLFPKEIPGGGTGWVYGCNHIFIITRSQEKKGTDIIGWNFNLSIMKSRCIKEKMKLPITVLYDGGINKWSALLDLAIEGGFVIKPSMGWYSRVFEDGVVEEKKWRAADTNCEEFWNPILKNQRFNEFIESTFKIAGRSLIATEKPDNESLSSFQQPDDEE